MISMDPGMFFFRAPKFLCRRPEPTLPVTEWRIKQVSTSCDTLTYADKLSVQESSCLEKKMIWSVDVVGTIRDLCLEYVTGLLNCAAGNSADQDALLLLGVSDAGKCLGVHLPEDIKEDVVTSLHSSLSGSDFPGIESSLYSLKFIRLECSHRSLVLRGDQIYSWAVPMEDGAKLINAIMPQKPKVKSTGQRKDKSVTGGQIMSYLNSNSANIIGLRLGSAFHVAFGYEQPGQPTSDKLEEFRKALPNVSMHMISGLCYELQCLLSFANPHLNECRKTSRYVHFGGSDQAKGYRSVVHDGPA
jgi:hypothetical protein